MNVFSWLTRRAARAETGSVRIGAAERAQVRITLNGQTRAAHCEPRMLLSDFLRHALGATGTHVGCEHGVCGACTVQVDGVAVRSCLMLAVQADGQQVDTVEGLAQGDSLNDLQAAFHRHHALQCGFCTPGILMSCEDYLRRTPQPDEHALRDMLSGHLCRCTGYTPIVAAVLEVAAARAADNTGRSDTHVAQHACSDRSQGCAEHVAQKVGAGTCSAHPKADRNGG